jgi:hypothetical protein
VDNGLTSYVQRENYVETIVRVTTNPVRVYSFICGGDDILVRERDERGILLNQQYASEQFFMWFTGERGCDYEPSSQRVAFVSRFGNLVLYDIKSGVEQTIWKGNGYRTRSQFVRFIDKDHVLLIYSEVSPSRLRTQPPPCHVVLVSAAGQAEPVADFNGAGPVHHRYLTKSKRLYFVAADSGDDFYENRYLGYIDFNGKDLKPKKIVSVLGWLTPIAVSPEEKRCAVIVDVGGNGVSDTRLIEVNLETGEKREVARLAEYDRLKAVYTKVRYLSGNEVAINISPEQGNKHLICFYDLRSGTAPRPPLSEANLAMFDVCITPNGPVIISQVGD